MDIYNGKVAYIGDVASEYDNLRTSEKCWEQEHHTLEWFLHDLLAGKTSKQVLDLPVGTGRFLSIYESMNINVVGMDISEDMLEMAKRKVNPSSAKNVSLKLGDVTNIKLDSKSVDVAVSFRLIHLLPPTIFRKGIKELCRVSREGVVIHGFNMIAHESQLQHFKRFVKSFAKKALTPKGNGDFSHINTFSHSEELLTELFNNEGFELHSFVTMDESESRSSWMEKPSRVYYFKRMHA